MFRRPVSASLRARTQRLAEPLILLLALVLLQICALPAALAQPARETFVIVEAAQGVFEDARVLRALPLAAPWQRMAQGTADAAGIVLRHGDRETALEAERANPEAVQRLLAQLQITPRAPRQYALFYEPPLERLAETTLKVLHQYGLEGKLQAITPQTREQALAATRSATGSQSYEIPYLILSQEQRAAPTPQRLADVTVFGEMVVDYDPQEQVLTVTTGVANVGEAPAGAHALAVRERGDRLRFRSVPIEPLEIQESAAFKAFAKVPEDLLGQEVQLQAVIDPEDTIRESDERNNRGPVVPYRLPAAAPRLPDLTVLEPPRLRFDEAQRELSVTIIVANLGSVAAGPHALSLADRGGGVTMRPLALEGLGSREKQDFRLTIPIPEESLGARLELVATIDPENAVRETDEANNESAAEVFTLPPPPAPRLPDLRVGGLTLSFDPQSRRLSATMTAVNGGEAAAGRHELRILEQDRKVTVPPVVLEGLAAGERQRLTGGATLAEDLSGETLRLRAVIDAAGAVRESDEDNNRGPLEAFTVPAPQGQADLAIVAMQVSRPARGDALEVRLTVANRGTAESPASEIDLRAEGASAWQRFDLPALASGATTEIAWTLPRPESLLGGRVEVSALADPDDRLPELLETNNAGRQAISLPVPLRSWLAGAALLGALILAVLWRLRRRPARDDRVAGDLHLSYRARRDPGRQTVESAEGGAPVRLSLRALRDPGRQLVVFSRSH